MRYTMSVASPASACVASVTPCCIACTAVNRNIAVAIPDTVRIVRTRCRVTCLTTRGR